MDRCYRYMRNNWNGQLLRQVSERGENMTDVRMLLGIRPAEWKMEERELERMGLVMRTDNERLTMAMILGLYVKLEG